MTIYYFYFTIISLPFKILTLWVFSCFLASERKSIIRAILIAVILSIVSFLVNIFNPEGFYISMLSGSLKYLPLILPFFLIKIFYELDWKETIWFWLPWFILQYPIDGIINSILMKSFLT